MADQRDERFDQMGRGLAEALFNAIATGMELREAGYRPVPKEHPDGPAAGEVSTHEKDESPAVEPLEAPPPPEPEGETWGLGPEGDYIRLPEPVNASPAVPERELEPVKSPASEPLEAPPPPVLPDRESPDIFRAHQESLAAWRAEYPSEAAWNRARQESSLGREAGPQERERRRIENAVERTEQKQDIIRARRRQADKQFRELGDRRPPKSATTAIEPPVPDWPAVGAMTEPPSPIPKTETPWVMPFEPVLSERDLPELKAPEPPGVAEQPAVEAPKPSAQRAAFVPSAPITPHGTSLLSDDYLPIPQSIGRSPHQVEQLEPPAPDARTGAREAPLGYRSGQALDITQRQLDRNAEIGAAHTLRHDLINFTRDQDLATQRANALQQQLNERMLKDMANDYRRLEWQISAAENSRETITDTVF